MRVESHQTTDAYTRREALKIVSLSSIAHLLNAIGCQSRKAVNTKQGGKKNAKVSLELADEKLLDHGVIRIGIISDAAEKERIRDQLKRALRFVLADTDLAIAYGNSKTVEHLVVPDMAETLKKIAGLAPNQFQHLDFDREVSQSAHGDAYTVAIETVDPQGKLLAVQNFMLISAPLVQPENYPQLIVTLDHECRHIMLRGKRLSRREEELQVYTSGIERMTKVAQVLQKRGGENAELGKKILTEALPVHQIRLNTWRRAKE